MFNRSDQPGSPIPPPAPQMSVEHMLVPGETLIETINTEQRAVTLTNMRVIIVEQDSSWSVIALAHITAFEVSRADGSALFVKIHFGGGLSRTVKARNVRDATVLSSCTAHQNP